MAIQELKNHPVARKVTEMVQSIGPDIQRRFRPMSGLLDYLESGRLPGRVDRTPPFPEWLGRGSLRIEDSFIKVEGVHITRLFPGMYQAYVDFSRTQNPEETIPLKVFYRKHDEQIQPVGGAGYTFGLWPLVSDLRNFAEEFAPSRIEAMNNDRVQTPLDAEEWLSNHR